MSRRYFSMNINQQVKPFMLMYRYDYFFHYLLINDEPLRLFLCQYISHDDSITYTTIENSETYKPSYDGKKLVLDVVVKDDKGRYYNFEMQNRSIEEEDQIRFMRYGERLVDMQEKKGIKLQNIKEVYQLIIYTGKAIEGLKRYRHDIRKADRQGNKDFKGDRVKTVILQIEKMKEEKEMEKGLEIMEQLNHLFYYNEIHKYSEMDELVKGVVKMHEEFIRSEDFIRACEIERERSLIEAKLQRAKDNGISQGKIEGKHEEKVANAKAVLQVLFDKEDISWIEECCDEKLDRVFQLIGKNLKYEEFKKIIQG